MFHAAALGKHEVAWKLAAILGEFFYVGRFMDDWLATHSVALASARELADPIAEAGMAHQYWHCIRGAESVRRGSGDTA